MNEWNIPYWGIVTAADHQSPFFQHKNAFDRAAVSLDYFTDFTGVDVPQLHFTVKWTGHDDAAVSEMYFTMNIFPCRNRKKHYRYFRNNNFPLIWYVYFSDGI